MMSTSGCDAVLEDLAALADGDREAVAKHAEHLASCDSCRDARHEATQLAQMIGNAGADHRPVDVEKLIATVAAKTAEPAAASTLIGMGAAKVEEPKAEAPKVEAPKAEATKAEAPKAEAPKVEAPPKTDSRKPTADSRRPKTENKPGGRKLWLVAGTVTALAAGATGLYFATHKSGGSTTTVAGTSLPAGAIGELSQTVRAAADHADGVFVRSGGGDWKPLLAHGALSAGAEVRTDERTRAWIGLADGSHLVLDHQTTISFNNDDARHMTIKAGRVLADIAHVDGHPAQMSTPLANIDVVGTRFVVTATDALASVQVVRGEIALGGEQVRAGEEGTLEKGGSISVAPVPQLTKETEWAETTAAGKPDEVASGLGSLRAYKPGESRDRDWNLALAKHDVKVRIVGPIARTEITETFRNDSTAELEGVYQFPLPADAQIDSLALDQKDGFIDGAFVDKERGAKIWKGVIDKATPHHQELATDIIWVNGSWRDPALLDWKRGGRFELRVFPIPAKGQRTIKLSYTQVVAPRGQWRQYVYQLPHSANGSTVADQLDVDVEIRGAQPGAVRTLGYEMQADPNRKDTSALTMHQAGFVPRGDLVVAYRATDGAAELRAWAYAGNAAVAPDEKLAEKKNVGIDPKVIEEQRRVAADTRPTAVVALRPNLPRWRESKARDYAIVIDASQSMVGERWTRASELATSLVEQMDRRDRFTVMTCDTSCRTFGDVRSPTPQSAGDAKTWLAGQTAAGATDVVASIRGAREALHEAQDRERWVLYIGDGFASTGFRRVADVEKALAGGNVHVTTIGIGSDADAPVLEAAARGGGGSYLSWLPGQRVQTAAGAALESTYGSALRDAKVELPAGLVDVAPTVLPTMRAGDEVLVAARVGGEVAGDVVLKGTVAGQPFEQRYPLKLAASTSPGNGFVPRLWASLAIEQREQAGAGEDRTKIVALSQAYGVMSRETSLLVLESQAMFDAFGVDRGQPSAKWTGEDSLDEVAASGSLPVPADNKPAAIAASKPAMHRSAGYDDDGMFTKAKADDSGSTGYGRGARGGGGAANGDFVAEKTPAPAKKMAPPPRAQPKPPAPADQPAPPATPASVVTATPPVGGLAPDSGYWNGGSNPYQKFAVKRTWVRVPAVTAYDSVAPSISKAIADAERGLAANPNSREKHRALVQSLAYAGEIERARQTAIKWLDRDRLDPQALGYQADLLGRNGKREDALRTLAGLVDLEADRVELHQRMVQAYDQFGRQPEACSHRIALAALQPKDAKVAGAALRCLRALGRGGDADLVARALPDDAARADAEKAATADVPAPKLAGDLVINAHWDGGADLDISLITPDATRVSWMGGKSDALVTDATSSEREELAIKSIKKGNYLVEISRGSASGGTVHGTLDITVLGSKKTLPFELAGDRTTVARIAVSLEERYEEINPYAEGGDSPHPRMTMGNVPDQTLRNVMMARSTDVRRCYTNLATQDATIAGRIVLNVSLTASGMVQLTTHASSSKLAPVEQCMQQAFGSMHGNPNAGSFSVAFSFSPR
jgi:Mg-chelatase subunit ChlD